MSWSFSWGRSAPRKFLGGFMKRMDRQFGKRILITSVTAIHLFVLPTPGLAIAQEAPTDSQPPATTEDVTPAPTPEATPPAPDPAPAPAPDPAPAPPAAPVTQGPATPPGPDSKSYT